MKEALTGYYAAALHGKRPRLMWVERSPSRRSFWLDETFDSGAEVERRLVELNCSGQIVPPVDNH